MYRGSICHCRLLGLEEVNVHVFCLLDLRKCQQFVVPDKEISTVETVTECS